LQSAHYSTIKSSFKFNRRLLKDCITAPHNLLQAPCLGPTKSTTSMLSTPGGWGLHNNTQQQKQQQRSMNGFALSTSPGMMISGRGLPGAAGGRDCCVLMPINTSVHIDTHLHTHTHTHTHTTPKKKHKHTRAYIYRDTHMREHKQIHTRNTHKTHTQAYNETLTCAHTNKFTHATHTNTHKRT